MDTAADYLIENESDFIDFLEEMKSKDLDDEDFVFPDVRFSGWPILDINVKGPKFHQTVTSSMIFGMSILNEEIQRAFATIRYGSQNLQRLTNEDRQNLDIVFAITEGSSDAEGPTDKLLNAVVTFLRDSMSGMTGWQKMVVVIAFIGAASTCGFHYITQNANVEQHATDRQAQIVQATNDGMNKALTTVLEYKQHGESRVSQEVETHGQSGKNGLVKQLAADPTVQSVSLGDKTISRQELNTYNGRQAVDRQRIEKVDSFFVKGVTRSGPYNTDININVIRASNDEGFTIKASGEVITPDELTALVNALSNNSLVKISYLEIVEKGVVSFGQFNTVSE